MPEVRSRLGIRADRCEKAKAPAIQRNAPAPAQRYRVPFVRVSLHGPITGPIFYGEIGGGVMSPMVKGPLQAYQHTIGGQRVGAQCYNTAPKGEIGSMRRWNANWNRTTAGPSLLLGGRTGQARLGWPRNKGPLMPWQGQPIAKASGSIWSRPVGL